MHLRAVEDDRDLQIADDVLDVERTVADEPQCESGVEPRQHVRGDVGEVQRPLGVRDLIGRLLVQDADRRFGEQTLGHLDRIRRCREQVGDPVRDDRVRTAPLAGELLLCGEPADQAREAHQPPALVVDDIALDAVLAHECRFHPCLRACHDQSDHLVGTLDPLEVEDGDRPIEVQRGCGRAVEESAERAMGEPAQRQRRIPGGVPQFGGGHRQA